MIEFFERVFQSITVHGTDVDQLAMNRALPRMIAAHGGRVARALDKYLYPTGYIFNKKLLNAKFEILPLVVHMNFLVGNARKKAAFKRHGLWFLGETFANVSIKPAAESHR